MVMLAVNVGLAKIDPVVRMGQWGDINQYRKRDKRNKELLHSVCSPLGVLRDFSGPRPSWCASAIWSSSENGSDVWNPERQCKLPEFWLPESPKVRNF
jgi:hypothetical protein